MNRHILPKFLITTATISCVLFSVTPLFAKSKAVPEPEDPYAMQTQAKRYRDEGIRYQQIGNLPEAKLWLQKATTLDPTLAAAYNDLGVIYETEGEVEKAEEAYLKALKADPAYLSTYTNIAFLYEGKRDLKKAEFYWNKRTMLGAPDDPWTQKAANRLRDIRSVTSDRPFTGLREEEVLSLMKDVKEERNTSGKSDEELSTSLFKRAQKSFNSGDLAAAIKLALDAQQLDEDNTEIEAFIEKAELRALSR